MSGRPGTSQLHCISALRASSVVAAGTPRAKSPPPRVSAFHPAHVVASQSLEACSKSYRAPAQAHISQPIVAQVAHIAHTSSRSRQPPTLHPHLCTYLQVRFPPLYAQVDALLGCWSMVAVCQERPWTPAVHRDRNVKRGARARCGSRCRSTARRKCQFIPTIFTCAAGQPTTSSLFP